MRWPDALARWPHSDLSRRVLVKPHRWHVQEMGQGDTLLLLHGAGGATHSWRDVMPLLAQTHHVVAVDLPGHGLTQLGTRSRSGLTAMSEDLLALCASQNWAPVAVVGHSAGGAAALRMAQLDPARVPKVLGINPALENFKGLAGVMFPIMAKALAMAPFTPDLFARSATRPGRLEALLESTGSKIDAEGQALYRTLVTDRDHVDGVLVMMAQWSLKRLIADLPKVKTPVHFLTGARDGTVPPQVSKDVAARLSNAHVTCWPDLGHLMHEEAPDRVAAWILGEVQEKSLPRMGQAVS